MFASLKARLYSLVKAAERNADVLKSMFKNTLPPTAALWAIQSTTIYRDFDTIGYLPIIVTIVQMPMLARVPFLQGLLVTCILNCVVAGVGLLAGYCVIQARVYTTPPGVPMTAYSSSASTVSAIWLFFTLWALQTFRAYQPQHLTSIIICSIFTISSTVTSTRLTAMSGVVNLNLQLLESFFLAHGFCAVTSLLVFPKTSRSVVLDDIQRVLKSAREVAALEKSFLRALGKSLSQDTSQVRSRASKDGENGAEEEASLATCFASVKAARTNLSQEFTKMQADRSTAKRDVGWSGLSANDLKESVSHLQALMLSLRGIVALGAAFRSICEWRHWTVIFDEDQSGKGEPKHLSHDDVVEQSEWKAIFVHAAELFDSIEQLLQDGLHHTSICMKQSDEIRIPSFLRLSSPPIPRDDAERSAEPLPGDRKFVRYFIQQIKAIRARIGSLLAIWRDDEGLGRTETREVSFQRVLSRQYQPQVAQYQDRYYREQQQLLVILYLQNLLRKILENLEKLVVFAEERKLEVDTKGKSLILPGKRTFWKMISKTFSNDNTDRAQDTDDNEQLPEAPILPGFGGTRRSTFEHLRPTTTMQRMGHRIAAAYGIIGSQKSLYGFRVASAVLSVTLIGFLAPTQAWFFNRRGLWAAVFIPISMAPSSGEAFTRLIYRILGSILALILSLLNWYIGGGVAAGVIFWFFVITFIEQYFLVQHPRYMQLSNASMITRAVIMGFELQLEHTKVPQPPVTEAQNFPVYLIGPYRFACIVIGVTVAFIWTVFPYSTTSASMMRERLGVAMFTLAEYHSCMHSAIISWARGHNMQLNRKGLPVSSAEHYTKAQSKLFARGTNLLAAIEAQALFSKLEPNLGGKFPKQHYDVIVREIDLLMSYMNMVIFTATSLPLSDQYAQSHGTTLEKERTRSQDITARWTAGLVDLIQACRSSSAQVTTILCLMASSVANQQPLPPDLHGPEPFYVAKQLQKLQPELMDLTHAAEPGYSVFAVIEVSNTMITQSLQRVLDQVKDLVGELNFETATTATAESHLKPKGKRMTRRATTA